MQHVNLLSAVHQRVCRDSSVGIVTRYGLDGPGIESRWGARFPVPDQTGPGAHAASNTLGTGSLPGVTAGAWRWSPTPSSAEVKERVDLYLYCTTGPSWRVTGWTLPFKVLHVFVFVDAFCCLSICGYIRKICNLLSFELKKKIRDEIQICALNIYKNPSFEILCDFCA
jgi:hypothetical protein